MKRLMRIALGVALAVAVLCALEGAASLLLLAWDLSRNAAQPLAERAHTVHDAELGWVNARSVVVPDLYGPGRTLTTNARGFRGVREVDDAIAAGKLRVVCSGDSFTLGYGVGDEHTWPAELAQLDARLETVNMGQGGYGLDQAYLWFARDAAALAHDVHLFAFVANDFERMRSSRFLGYGKPRLYAGKSGLVVGGVPVPAESMRSPWWTQNSRRFFDLRLLSLARRATGPHLAEADAMGDVEAHAVSAQLFSELARLDAAKHSRLVLVFLPNKDHTASGRLTRLTGWMQRAVDGARASGTAWIDLSEDFEGLTDGERERLFIPRGEIGLPGAAGHYSAAGNRFVAERLHARLDQLGLLAPKR